MERYNVKEVEFCEGCNVDLCGPCAFNALRDSRYGDMLKNNPPRFGRWAFEDNQRFIKLLGHDVDPLKHGLHQAYEVAIPFIEAQNNSPWHKPFTPAEAKILFLGNILHDAHEGVTGDVALPDKTLASDMEEQLINMTVVAEILGLSQDDPFLKHYESVVWDLEGWSHAGRAFKAIEAVGYVETGLKAWAARNHADLDDDERAKVADMGHAVLTLDTPLLTPYIGEFVYVANVYHRAKTQLDQL